MTIVAFLMTPAVGHFIVQEHCCWKS